MRKIFVLVILVLFAISGNAFANVESDPELHKIIGGLYSLVCAVRLNENLTPDINQLKQFFANIPDNWQNEAQVSRVKNSIWVSVSVGKYSTARQFLREHSSELGIMESPNGYAWLGGSFAWIKAADIERGRLKIAGLKSARGAGNDSGIIFFSMNKASSWWMAYPDFTEEASQRIIKLFGADNAPELHKPSRKLTSIYESVKPSEVHKPDDIRMSRRKSSFDMDIELGEDVIFNPIPNTRRR